MNILTAIMDVEMLYFHTHKQVILKFDNLTISQFEVSYEVLFISFSTTLFQYFSIILEKINIIQITKLVTVSCTCFKMLDAISVMLEGEKIGGGGSSKVGIICPPLVGIRRRQVQ